LKECYEFWWDDAARSVQPQEQQNDVAVSVAPAIAVVVDPKNAIPAVPLQPASDDSV
jgi:hypothetical protein